MKFLNFAKYNSLYLITTLVISILSLTSVYAFGLIYGIDFSGGTVLDYSFQSLPETVQVSDYIESEGFDVSRIVTSEGSRITIYLGELNEESIKSLDNKL